MVKQIYNATSLFQGKTPKVETIKISLPVNYSKEAELIFEFYHSTLFGSHDKKRQACVNIDNLFKMGFTSDMLKVATIFYNESLKKPFFQSKTVEGIRKSFVIACQNFFSPEQRRFEDYLQMKESEPVSVKTEIEVTVERF
jgi:hypothetical protein